jgi:hypothetical protein
LQQAVQNAHGTHPRRAVRFIMAPQAVPMVGVSIASRDREGRAFPLVLLRRLPAHTRDVPWTLLLGLYASYLSAAESCLWLGQHVPLAQLLEVSSALELPHPSTIAGALHEASSNLGVERVHAFAERNLPAPACERALERLRHALHALQHAAEAPSPIPTLELPAQGEFDLYVWLELLRAQLDAMDKPRALFWCPAEQRALIDLGDPSPHVFSYLAEPNERSPACRLPHLAARPPDAPSPATNLHRKHADPSAPVRSAFAAVLDPQVARLIERNASLAELAGALAVAG